MQRRAFLTATLATPVILTQAETGNTASNPTPFVVKSGDARFGVHTPYRGTKGVYAVDAQRALLSRSQIAQARIWCCRDVGGLCLPPVCKRDKA